MKINKALLQIGIIFIERPGAQAVIVRKKAPQLHKSYKVISRLKIRMN